MSAATSTPYSRALLIALLSALAVAAVGLGLADRSQAQVPIYDFDVRASSGQAGGHPDVSVRLEVGTLATETPEACFCNAIRDITVNTPAGLVGVPSNLAQCTTSELVSGVCPVDSQVGVVVVRLYAPLESGGAYFVQPLYNMEPRPGQLALLATPAPLLATPIYTNVSARTESDYGLEFKTFGLPRLVPPNEITQFTWGVPADHKHDIQRFSVTGSKSVFCFEGNPLPFVYEDSFPTEFCGGPPGPNVATAPATPFLLGPTTCTGALLATLDTSGYENGREHADDLYPETTGCDQLAFNPSLSAAPTTTETDSPSGLNVNLKVPQFLSPSAPSPSQIKGVTVSLPAGLTIDPNVADGKTSCSDAEAAFGSREEAHCPEYSKIGSLTINSSALPAPLPGYIYLGEPLPGDRYRLLLVADGFSLHIKLPGTATPDPRTGQVTVSFKNLPQTPFQEFDMHFFGAERGLLATPTECGKYEVRSEFEPWAAELPNQTSNQFFTIDSGPGGTACPAGARPFSPRTVAGVTDNTGGAHTSFSFDLNRGDGEQALTAVDVKTPPGFAAVLAGIPYCPDAALAATAAEGASGLAERAAPNCPAASLIGSASATAGAGSRPIAFPGKVYLAGPYKGAPLSLAIVTPSVAGPYDLGNVVIRVAILVDPVDAHITALSDPLPLIVGGIPLRLRGVTVVLDRPNFAINPTNCSPFAVITRAFGDQGGSADGSIPFQVAGCGALPYGPKLSLKLRGGTARRGHPAIRATFTAKRGESNTRLVSVALPKGELLDNSHLGNVCTRPQFSAGSCPASSMLGTASASTPLLAEPLSGNVYLRANPGGKLPNVVMDLRGQFRIELVGTIDTVRGGALRTTFETVPDAPVSSFTLDLLGGAKGLIQNSESLCGAKRKKATTRMVGQNGATLKGADAAERELCRQAEGEALMLRKATLALAATVLASLAIASSAQADLEYVGSFGSTGTGAGQFWENEYGPGGIAVNDDLGRVYVTDPGQNRIQVFDEDGNFILMWGQSVDEGAGDICTAASGHTCTAGALGGTAGAFNRPQGVGVDPDTGSVYVQDASNNRVQKFTADGQFVLTWGKGVNATTGGNICTAASGNVCKPGSISGNSTTTPPTPSIPGGFAGWEQAAGPGLDVDVDGFVYVTDPRAVDSKGIQARIQKFDPDGNFVSQLAGQEENFIRLGLNYPGGLSIAPDGHVYVLDESFVKQFDQNDFSIDGKNSKFDRVYSNPKSVFDGARQVAVDPHNGFVFVGNGISTNAPCPAGGQAGAYKIEEFHPNGEQVDCTIPSSPSVNNGQIEAGMAVSASHRLYVGNRVSDEIRIYRAPVETQPDLGPSTAGEITSKAVRLQADLAANLAETTYHIEYGAAPCSTSACQSTAESPSIGASFLAKLVDARVEGLTPGATYYYRFVATNKAGSTAGPDLKFATFPAPVVDNSCINNLARQQSRSANLLNCRSYELVSAESTGGYNVESDLVPGGEPFRGYPGADSKVLYAVHDGGIPGTGKPTNRGPDPYVAVRNEAAKRWETKYVGVPADAPSTEPFQSTVAGASSDLGTLAFGGPDICDPCFSDGRGGIPVRTPDGALVQGMAGSEPVAKPAASGEVRKALSDDGSTLVFGSTQRFTPAGNSSGTDLTIYQRSLSTGATEVASTMPDGTTIANGSDLAALDLAADGSRILIGVRVGNDGAGNDLYDLYMHTRGDPDSVEVADTASGVLYAGMTADGSSVYFTTTDQIGDDGDSSSDLYRASLSGGPATVSRVSIGSGGTGNTDSCAPPTDWNVIGRPGDCSVVGLAGGVGVAAGSGRVYFVSPELLDGAGNGIADQANLYTADPGEAPEFVATIDSTLVKPGPQPPKHPLADSNFAGEGLEGPGKMAVDQLTGDLYVAEHNANRVTRYDSSGQPHDFTAGAGAGTNSIPNVNVGSYPERAVGVDSSPASPFSSFVYIVNSSHEIKVFAPRAQRQG